MKQPENNVRPRNALQSGYELLWYNIKSVLGQGAFGITYLAQDINLNRLVAIKEFLPSQYAMRDTDETVGPVSVDFEEKFADGLRRFIEEARILDQLDHPNIIRVMNIFEENNTAYMVMSYEQGVNLKEILLRQKMLDEADLLNILFPILDGLETIHESGFIHRDIKPANIFIRTDGTPVLLDFGSARQSLEKDTHTLTSLVSPGYAPIEQYVSKSDKQGPWSDIYGVAATLYRAVTGVQPSDAVTRGEALTGSEKDNLISCRELADERYSDQFVAAIDHGLAFLTRERPQTIAEWKQEFLHLESYKESVSRTATISPTEKSDEQTPSQIAAFVQESLTESVTRVNDNFSASGDYWDKEDATSVELAHKQGFQRGLKLSLVILTLLIGGLFVGNFQKIQQVVRPTFVPETTTNEPSLASPVDASAAQETASGVNTDITEMTAAEIAENPPAILDEKTADELEADGKIIIIDEGRQTAIDTVTISTSDGSKQLAPLTGDELFNEFPAEAQPEQQIILEDEMVVESQGENQLQHEFSEETVTIDKTAGSSSTVTTNAVSPDAKPSQEKNAGEVTRSQEIYVPNRDKYVVIEEVHVPSNEEKKTESVTQKLKNFFDFMVNGGDSSSQEKRPNDQAGGQILEDRWTNQNH